MTRANSLSTSRNQSSTRRVLARSLLIALALCVLSAGFYFAHRSGSNPEIYSNDFNVYYHAGKEVLAGRDPYQSSLGEWTPYLYPPLLAELITPLAMLSLPAAAYLWFVISAVAMFGAAWMSALACEREQEPSFTVRLLVAGVAVLVVLRFTLDSFSLGQVNPIVAALSVAHVFFYARNKRALSAVALAIAISIKLTPALLIVYHIARLRLRFVIVCIGIVAGITALSFLPFAARGPGAFRVFVNRTLKNEQGYDLGDSGNQSVRGAIARMAGGNKSGFESKSPLEPVTMTVTLALLLFAMLAARRAKSEVARAAPFLCCVVLLSPLSWKAHYVILVLPVAYLVFSAFHSETSQFARRLFLSAIVAAFILFNLSSPRVIGLAAAEWTDAHSLVTIGALLIFVTVLGSGCWPRAFRKFGKHQRVC